MTVGVEDTYINPGGPGDLVAIFAHVFSKELSISITTVSCKPMDGKSYTASLTQYSISSH